MDRFPPVDPRLDLPALDRRILELWRERGVFERSVEQRKDASDGKQFVFYEGPPTGNGRPGVHHVEARAFKDLFPRFKTMRGYRVERKGGWDCHGLPVELEVERELGLASKREIEAYGIEAFNARCRASVERYVNVWEQLTERIGFWIDTEHAYRTMDTSYVESVWWALAELHRRGLLFEDYKVVPYCPRCQTALSDAELALGYEEVDDESAYVRFPVTSGPLAEEGADLLVWTTTPWTLLANVAVAAGPEVDYVLAEPPDHTPGGRRLVVARSLVERALGEGSRVVRPVPLSDLVGTTYRRPFDLVPLAEEPESQGTGTTSQPWRVVAAEYVSATDGTGLVHIAPAFGSEDMDVARRERLPVLHPVDSEGRFVEGMGELSGLGVKQADSLVVGQLRRQGLLWRTETYHHDYPHCWRCKTPLLYYALTSWYARTTARKDRLLAENATIGWHPEHIRDGRFGDWLANNVDWALSRARYWGTPLPLWRCPAGHVTVVESLADLSAKAGRDLRDLDPHRPYVDEVTLPCPQCGEEARRVPDVLDAWFDSGSMPFAQWGYPHEDQSPPSPFWELFPADFISEAIDQTRGWFYSLLAVSVLLFDSTPYRNVVCLGHLVDRDGRKMSKSLGNVLDPFELLDRYGADPLRWFMLASGSPWASRRLSPEVLEEITRSFFLTLWNTYSFFSLYARLAGFDPEAAGAAELPLDLLDRWVLARLAETVRGITADLDAYDSTAAARRLTVFVDDLSNWYVRLSRRRFWRTEGPESEAAFHTLWTCLRTLALLLAPYAPFVAEELWQGLTGGTARADATESDSVHLADWPEPAVGEGDAELLAAMEEARRLVRLGRQARTESGIRVRQPLPRALVTVDAAQRRLVDSLLGLVATELNVKEVGFTEGDSALVTIRLVPNFRSLGPRLGRAAPQVAQAIRTMGDEAVRTVAARLLAGEPAEAEVPGVGVVTLTQDDAGVIEEPVTGWHVVREGTASVALDVHVTDELRREGIARDLVRAIQDLRKASGLAVDDRIELAVTLGEAGAEAEAGARADVGAALDAHRDYVMSETLATALHAAPPEASSEGGHETVVELSGARVGLWLRPVAH